MISLNLPVNEEDLHLKGKATWRVVGQGSKTWTSQKRSRSAQVEPAAPSTQTVASEALSYVISTKTTYYLSHLK